MINNKERDADFYNRIFSKKSLKYFRRYDSMYKTAMNYIERRDRVLEIGCGMGYFAGKYLAGNCHDFLAFDFSTYGIGTAKKFFPGVVSKFKTFDMRDIDKLRFKYNVACCLEVLEHTDHDVEVLKLLHPGTRVIASVPKNEVCRNGKPKGYPVHRRSYSAGSILERYGEVMSVDTVEKLKSWFLFSGVVK